MFESSVNSDSIQTIGYKKDESGKFESSVNSDSIQTKFQLTLRLY